jgi:hypothetical protein
MYPYVVFLANHGFQVHWLRTYDLTIFSDDSGLPSVPEPVIHDIRVHPQRAALLVHRPLPLTHYSTERVVFDLLLICKKQVLDAATTLVDLYIKSLSALFTIRLLKRSCW